MKGKIKLHLNWLKEPRAVIVLDLDSESILQVQHVLPPEELNPHSAYDNTDFGCMSWDKLYAFLKLKTLHPDRPDRRRLLREAADGDMFDEINVTNLRRSNGGWEAYIEQLPN